MGLDMYLNTASQGHAKHMYDWHVKNGYWDDQYDNWRPPMGIIGYWRKANHIHQWMVNNVQRGNDDCNPHEITPQKMEELIKTCDRVLKAHDIKVSNTLLPTSSGFFFGSTDYDDYYYADVEYTKALFEEILNNIVFRKSDKPLMGHYEYVNDNNWDCRINYLSSW